MRVQFTAHDTHIIFTRVDEVRWKGLWIQTDIGRLCTYTHWRRAT